jgi:cytochrome c-type biogenesis protein CcmH
MMTRQLRAMVVALALAVGALGLWQAAQYAAPPNRAQTARAVAESLRCPTCQGLSAADSPSPVAVGIRDTIGQQLDQGRSPDQIRAWFVARYSSWILLSPPRRGLNWLVWGLPSVAMVGLGSTVVLLGRHRRRAAAALTEPDSQRAARVLGQFLAGSVPEDISPAGERLQTALAAAVLAAEDGLPGQPPLQAIARALTARDQERRDQASATARVPRIAGSRRVISIVAGAAGAVTAVAVLLLIVSLRPRLAGQVPTGDAFTQPTAASLMRTPDLSAVAGSGSRFTGPSLTLNKANAAVAAHPTDEGAWMAVGRAYGSAGNLAQAARAYGRALKLKPADPAATVLLASVLLEAGDPAEAARMMQKLRNTDPSDADAVLVLGLAQEQLQDPAASATLRLFLALAPQHPLAPMIRASLR